MAHEVHQNRTRDSILGHAVVLLGAALFVTSCFLPYYGVAGGRSVSLYDQMSVAQNGGLGLGAILVLFGGLATVVVVAILGLTQGERPSLRAFLAGAVAAWSLTWIGSLLEAVNLRDNALTGRLSLEVGFWLQAVSIGVAVIGTILVVTRRTGAREHHAPGIGSTAGSSNRMNPDG